jgi:hypothetical protein
VTQARRVRVLDLPLDSCEEVSFLPSLQQFFSHTLVVLQAVSLSLIRRTACTRAQFSGCSSTSNAYSETGQTAVCCKNLTLGALTSRSALSVLVGALFKKFGLFLNPPHIYAFCIYLRTHSDLCHLHHKLIGFYSRVEKCLLRGTNWVFK